MKRYWEKDYGDRRQEIVFIGLKNQMNESEIRGKLADCLVEDYLMAPDKFAEMEDPFPQWFKKAS